MMKTLKRKTPISSRSDPSSASGHSNKLVPFFHCSSAGSHLPFLTPVIQPKLTVNAPDDKYEREADRVADTVMRMPDPLIFRQPIKEEGEKIQMKKKSPAVQRKCAECEEEENRLQRKPLEGNVTPFFQRKEAGGGEVSQQTAASLQSTKNGGKPLPVDTRGWMESRFGADFSGVRVHAGSYAVQLSRELNAKAFTYGSDIYFNRGEFSPGTNGGKRLLAHELTHVVQQGERNNVTIQRWQVGAAPAPAGWQLVDDPEHLRRLGQAEEVVRRVLGYRNCRNYFRDNCTNGAGANALQQAFDNARIYLRPVDDNIFGVQSGVTSNIAFNLRSFRIGPYMMASTLLHEMFHTCDPHFDAQDELDAENAVETCRLHAPWIDTVSPRSGTVGDRITIRGWGFGPTRGPSDEVRIGSIVAPVESWRFMTDNSSRVEIIVTVPSGATTGNIVVINNNVESNISGFSVI